MKTRNESHTKHTRIDLVGLEREKIGKLNFLNFKQRRERRSKQEVVAFKLSTSQLCCMSVDRSVKKKGGRGIG